jgi:hypothetical protein
MASEGLEKKTSRFQKLLGKKFIVQKWRIQIGTGVGKRNTFMSPKSIPTYRTITDVENTILHNCETQSSLINCYWQSE